MPSIIDYYYAPVSGYAYLGEPRLVEIANRYNATINFRPVDIMKVFAASGTVPPPKQPEARLAYRLLDLQRTADYLGLPVNPRPRHWPVPVELAARAIYATVEKGVDPHRVSFAILSAVYAQERDVSDPGVIKDILSQLNLDCDDIWAAMHGDSVSSAYQNATEQAISLGIFGSPTYVLDETEMFFGQDRLFLLDHTLAKRDQS
jgi:2-hydroxychromene-2-carboxylate isomerase